MARSLSEAAGNTHAAFAAPQSRANTVLWLVEPAAGPAAPQFASASERAGAGFGALAWRLFAAPLRWLDARQAPASAPAPRLEASAAAQPTPRPSAASARPTPLPHAATSASAAPAAFLAGQRAAATARRDATGARLPEPVVTATAPVAAVTALPATPPAPLAPARESAFPKAYELAAETIPPLVTLALGKWLKPSWAQVAETGCSVAINATRMYRETPARPAADRPWLSGAINATFAVASGVAAISTSGLIGLATTSPWLLAGIGGVLLLAIIWRVLEAQDAPGAGSWLSSLSLAIR